MKYDGYFSDDAVSEVIGVMLMISVTLIIVALVAVYATGAAGDTTQPIKADLVASGTMVDKDTDAYQVVFEHRAGDAFDVDQLAVSIGLRENSTLRMILSNDDTGERIACFDPDESIVRLGDRFKVSIGEYDKDNGNVTLGGSEIECGKYHLTYRFIDRRAGAPISSGEILIDPPEGTP
ncbi:MULTISPECIES: type IV pilin N-terminal domain-containing protein [unclassified Methanoculleus]|jgi:FlaG/FlaF family flagellin (archaellin)|uniref:Type IV pilin N-terminal domain-containing protein n=1 Tax=Methanoculleus palmolei TaxID=72612 RepID=A0ABD8A5S5_9EURY|nr:type IV pilin N-terminal domain-containing protein [Methanoculleus sp. UBA377]WOX54909.1 type IV pilin N-terminal domain-containing protein [Methanoculleus palmolei]